MRGLSFVIVDAGDSISLSGLEMVVRRKDLMRDYMDDKIDSDGLDGS